MDIGAWLAETYGQDLSGVTEIKEVPSNVTGALLFSRSKEKRLSFFLFFTDDAIEVVLADEATNANLLTPLAPLPTASPRVASTTRQMHRSRHTRLERVRED